MATEKTVPTYAADGRRLRSYTLEAIERLLQLDLIAVQRNRAGRIVTAHFRDGGGANPIRNSAHMGQNYSFEEMLPSGNSAWKHSDLFRDKRDRQTLYDDAYGDVAAIDLFVRGIFRAVPLSCMSRPETPTSPAKVVSIDTGRKRKAPTTARPIEFDSERRIA